MCAFVINLFHSSCSDTVFLIMSFLSVHPQFFPPLPASVLYARAWCPFGCCTFIQTIHPSPRSHPHSPGGCLLADVSVLRQPGGRGAGQPHADDRAGRDCQPSAVTDGITEPAWYRLHGCQRKEEQPVLRHHQSQLWSQAWGRWHHVSLNASKSQSHWSYRWYTFHTFWCYHNCVPRSGFQFPSLLMRENAYLPRTWVMLSQAFWEHPVCRSLNY